VTTVKTARARILVDATPLWATSGLRGIGRYLRDLLTGLARVRGNAPDLEILAVRSLVPHRASVTADLDAVVAESLDKGGSTDLAQRTTRRFLLSAVLRRHGASLVHLPEMFGTPLTLPVPMVATCHDLIPLRHPEWYLPSKESATSASRSTRALAYAVRWLKDQRRYRRARRVVAISPQTRDDLVSILRLREDKIDVVPSGLVLERYRRHGDVVETTPHPRPYILYVGFCDPRKNMPALFATLSILSHTHDLDLLWAGDIDKHWQQTMTSLASEHNVSTRVHLLGFVSDEMLGRLYRHAVSLVFLSKIEGFGLPVVEAMAAGCPVVVARGSGSDKLVAQAGVQVDASDPEEVACAVRRLIEQPAHQNALRSAGLVQVEQFSCEAMAWGYVSTWRRSLGSGTGYP
jgi:glycosyltransferase involved in cell wall biosynthesis